MRARSVAVVAVVAMLLGGAAGYLAARPDEAGYRSIAHLVDALDRAGLHCGGALTVHVSRGVEGEIEPFENGSCPRFDGDDEGDFFSFAGGDSLDDYLAEVQRSRGGEGPGISAVVGPNWLVSVRLEETARRVQDAVGGELVGY